VGAAFVDDRYRLQVLHEARQVFEVPPEAVQLLRRLPDRDRAPDLGHTQGVTAFAATLACELLR
jgi:hypothetical protein